MQGGSSVRERMDGGGISDMAGQPETPIVLMVSELELDVLGSALYDAIHLGDRRVPFNPVRLPLAEDMMDDIEGLAPLTVVRAEKLVQEWEEKTKEEGNATP